MACVYSKQRRSTDNPETGKAILSRHATACLYMSQRMVEGSLSAKCSWSMGYSSCLCASRTWSASCKSHGCSHHTASRKTRLQSQDHVQPTIPHDTGGIRSAVCTSASATSEGNVGRWRKHRSAMTCAALSILSKTYRCGRLGFTEATKMPSRHEGFCCDSDPCAVGDFSSS